MTARTTATSLLAHYFRTAFQSAGLDWDGDHESEMVELVDALHAMVVDEIRENVHQVESTPDADDQVVPTKDLPMLLAMAGPDLPYVALGRLAAALDKAGYRVVRKATTEAGAPC